jgi:hypothetical protein
MWAATESIFSSVSEHGLRHVGSACLPTWTFTIREVRRPSPARNTPTRAENVLPLSYQVHVQLDMYPGTTLVRGMTV